MRMLRSLTTLAALLLAATNISAGTMNASPVTFDFEELRLDNAEMNVHDRIYGGIGRSPLEPFSANACLPTPGGCFMLVAHHYSPVANPPRFISFGTLRSDFPGSTALYHHRGYGEIVLMRTDGGSFDLLQIDLAELPTLNSSGNVILSGPFSLSFYGTKSNGRVVSKTVTLTNVVFGLERFQFERFEDLVSVSWFQGGGGLTSPTHQFDNLVVVPR